MSAASEITRKLATLQRISNNKTATQAADRAWKLGNYCSFRVRLERKKAEFQRLCGQSEATNLAWWLAASLVMDHGKPELKAGMLSQNPKTVQGIIDAVLYDGGIETTSGYWVEIVE